MRCAVKKSNKSKILHKIDIALGVTVWVTFVISSVISYFTKSVQANELAKMLGMVICFQSIVGIILSSIDIVVGDLFK